MKRIIIFCVFSALFVASKAYAALSVTLSETCMTNGMQECIISDDVCYWCGSNPAGNCRKGYAGCFSAGYVVAPGGSDMLYAPDSDGFYGYRCGSGGWVKQRLDPSCRSTEYYHSELYTCIKCPDTGIFLDLMGEKGPEVKSMVDATHHFNGITSCCADIDPRQQFIDDAGVFQFGSKCCHSEEEPTPTGPDDSASWCS